MALLEGEGILSTITSCTLIVQDTKLGYWNWKRLIDIDIVYVYQING